MTCIRKKFSGLFLLLAIWFCTIVGIRSVPLEKHEVFVLETAREMLHSGNWILPQFDNSPRLQKPPFSYWATAWVCKLDPFNKDVQVWHGRFVSLLASLLMALLTAELGTLLYNRRIGLLSALLLMSMQGFVHLAHNARPDFLYSAFGMLQLTAWLVAFRADDGSARQNRLSLIGWFAAGLATLTKGPQLPFVFLLGILAALLTSPHRKRIVTILKPLTGVLLFCVLVLPWWVVLNRQLDSLGVSITDGQVSGSLLTNLASWKEILSGYYIWMLPALAFPASLLIPVAIVQMRKQKVILRDETRILIFATISLLIVFTLGGHYRKHYMTPLLPLTAIFFAHALSLLPRSLWSRKNNLILFSVITLFCVGCVTVILFQDKIPILLITAAAAYPLFLLLKNELKQTHWQTHPQLARPVIAVVLMVLIATGYNAFMPVNAERAAEASFSRNVKDLLKPDDLLIEWRCSLEVLPFFAEQTTIRFFDAEKLDTFIKGNSGSFSIFVVLSAKDLQAFCEKFPAETLLCTRLENPEKDWVMVRILRVSDTRSALPHQAEQSAPDVPFLLFFLTHPGISTLGPGLFMI